MAKELNETTVSMEIVYDGVKTTLDSRYRECRNRRKHRCDEEAVRPAYYLVWRALKA